MADMEVSPARPGPTKIAGRACTTCSRAKTKCLWSEDDPTCQRCARLRKECQAVTVPRKSKYAVRSKHEFLERKLDRLESLIQAAQSSQSYEAGTEMVDAAGSLPSPESLVSVEGEKRSPLARERSLCGRTQTSSTTGVSYDAPILSGTRSSISTSKLPFSSLEPNSIEAEICLNRFRVEMLPRFPILVLADSLTAAQLLEEQPFLWLCIMSISGRRARRQKALANEVRITLARAVMFEGKNDLDLLLGTLVISAWGQYHSFDKKIASNQLHMAQAIAANMFLARPKPPEINDALAFKILSYTPRGCPKPWTEDCRTMPERRALLALFLQTAKTSGYFQRVDATPWTPYHDECMRTLETAKQHESDELLVALVKLQLLIEKAAQALIMQNSDVTDGLTRVPPLYHYRGLESELLQIKRNMSPALEADVTLRLQFNQVSLSIHEIAMTTLAPCPETILSIPRLDFLSTCFRIVDDSLSTFRAMPIPEFGQHPLWTNMQFGHCVIILLRLSTFDVEGVEWNIEHVRTTWNLSTVLGEMTKKMGNYTKAVGYDDTNAEDPTMFDIVSQMFRGMKSWWDHKMETEKAEKQQANELSEAIEAQPIDLELTDAWFNELVSNGDFAFDPFMQMPNF